MLLAWKKKNSFENVLKTQFSANNATEQHLAQALESFPREDFALKQYLAFQQKQGNDAIYQEVFDQIATDSVKHLFLRMLVFKCYVKSDVFNFEMKPEWNNFFQKNLNVSNK